MARGHFHKKFGGCIFVLLAFIQFQTNGITEGTRIFVKKRIESADGDVVDCVDIDKQPAFSHPLLKNHIIQMEPSSHPRGLEARNSSTDQLFQSWHMNGECPQGTIPILRTQVVGPQKVIPPIPQFNKSFSSSLHEGHEYATVSLYQGNYFGAHASFNVWTPRVAGKMEFSLSQVWLVGVANNPAKWTSVNTMEAGWQVWQGDKQPRFFIYWTRDGYQSTGCYNLQCPGFVQTNRRYAIGTATLPASTYGGNQSEINVTIRKDKKSGNWWLQLQDQVLGYWPGSIFTSLAEKATGINFGGEIINTRPHGHHTSTQMGSGHFPNEGYGKASYIAHIGYIDNANVVRDASDLFPPGASFPSCYDIIVPEKTSTQGVHFYFGGPGFSAKCQ